MSEFQHVYNCFKCSAIKEYREGETVPICCDRPMVRETLPFCTNTSHPEMVRNSDNEEPCDDGRGAK